MAPDATVTTNMVQAAYVGNAGGGSGTLHYRGVAYPFTVGGLGGGIGVSKSTRRVTSTDGML